MRSQTGMCALALRANDLLGWFFTGDEDHMVLLGKRVVVLGGTSGIGFAVAEAALREHADVVVASSSNDKVGASLKRLSNGAKGFAVDVRKEEDVASFFSRLGSLDHLVYTAGDWVSSVGGSIGELDLAAAAGA